MAYAYILPPGELRKASDLGPALAEAAEELQNRSPDYAAEILIDHMLSNLAGENPRLMDPLTDA